GGEVMEKRVARCGCGGSGAAGGDDDYRDGDEGGIVVVAESEYGDRVDPVVRTTFGVRRKIPPEKFSGGGGRNPVGEGGRRWGGMRGEREGVEEDDHWWWKNDGDDLRCRDGVSVVVLRPTP
ncbi:hypothetical protein Tco_1577801, partial [Tanacetum coccineum]